MRRSSVGRLLDLVGSALGEGDAEESQKVVVGRLDHHVGLDQRLPLAHQRPQLVGCEVEAVEVGQAVLALDFVDAQLDLAEGVVLVVLEVSERDFEDTALQSIVGVLETGRAVDEGLADTTPNVNTGSNISKSVMLGVGITILILINVIILY